MKIPHRFLLGGLSAAVLLAAPMVSDFEGRRLQAYLDPVSIPTICDGITKGVQLGQTKTHAECDDLLFDELKSVEAQVDQKVKVKLSPQTKAAILSFTYNVGIGAFSQSTLLRRLNANDLTGACKELPRWVYAKGIKWPGLVTRRKKEMELCLAGIGRPA